MPTDLKVLGDTTVSFKAFITYIPEIFLLNCGWGAYLDTNAENVIGSPTPSLSLSLSKTVAKF